MCFPNLTSLLTWTLLVSSGWKVANGTLAHAKKKTLQFHLAQKYVICFGVFFTFFSSFFKQIICQSSIFETNKSKDILILKSPLYSNVSVTPQYSTVRSILLFAVGLKNNLQGEWNQLKINFNIKEERNLESKMSLNSLKFYIKVFHELC